MRRLEQAAASAELPDFLLEVLNSLQLVNHVEFCNEPLALGDLFDSLLGLLHLELLLAPLANLVDERGAGLEFGEFLDEPPDIFVSKVFFHQALQKKGVSNGLMEPEHVNQPAPVFMLFSVFQIAEECLLEYGFHPPVLR